MKKGSKVLPYFEFPANDDPSVQQQQQKPFFLRLNRSAD
jgi:hypothetical protein